MYTGKINGEIRKIVPIRKVMEVPQNCTRTDTHAHTYIVLEASVLVLDLSSLL